MNAKKLISMGITLAALSMLTACEAGPVTPGTPGTPASNQPGTPQTATSNATMNILPGEVTQSATQHNEADVAAYNGAMQLKDAAYCDKINDEAFKVECKTTLSDQLALAMALQKMDPELCTKLSTKEKQDACKIQIEVAIKQRDEAAKKEQELSQESIKAQSYIDSQDYTKCKELKEKSLIQDCELNILVNKAMSTKDSSWCDKASTDKIKQTCLSGLNP